MSRKYLIRLLSLIALLATLAGCVQPTGAPAAAQPAAAPAEGGTGAGKYYWVQNSAWHPVHQLTQLSFLEGCADLGLECELATTDENTLEALVAMVDQTIARPDVKGIAMWFGGNPAVVPLVRKAAEKNIPIAFPHFPVDQSFYENAPNVVQISADTTKYPDPVAKAMCEELQKEGLTTGSVAVTQNGHNATEDMVAKVFIEGMKNYCPNLKILDVQLEGPEPTQAIAVATSIIQANPDIVAGFSTTGGGPTTWAGAQKETGKKLLAVGMDYTRVNLDLVKNGEVWGIVAQPLYTECKGAAELLAKMANGEKVPYWTVLDAPLVTKDNLDEYYAILDKMEAKMRPAVNPDEAKKTK